MTSSSATSVTASSTSTTPLPSPILGQLSDATGKAIIYPCLWEIVFGERNQSPAGAAIQTLSTSPQASPMRPTVSSAAISNTTTSTAPADLRLQRLHLDCHPHRRDLQPRRPSASLPPTTSAARSTSPAPLLPASPAPSPPVRSPYLPQQRSIDTVTIQTSQQLRQCATHLWTDSHGVAIAAALLLPFGSLFAFTAIALTEKRGLLLLGLSAFARIHRYNRRLLQHYGARLRNCATCPNAPTAPATPTHPPAFTW